MESLTFQPEEVVDAKWVNEETLRQMEEAGELAPFKAQPFAFFPY